MTTRLDGYTIRRMARKDIDTAIQWAAAEGWNPGARDADAFYAADSGGFLIGEIKGIPVATISAVSYGRGLGFIGFYIVKPEFRGKGYGLRIWQAAMARMGTGRNVGLDGVLAQQANYRKSGFQIAYNNTRYEGKAVASADAPNIVPVRHLAELKMDAYDTSIFTVARPKFLRQWLRLPDSTALSMAREGKVTGYGVIRKCLTGHKVGPLFADDAATAEALFAALTARHPGETVYLDTPDVNREAVALAKRHNMSAVFQTARMYTKSPPAAPLEKVYGVTSYELG